jgi:hypothetical protein
LPFKVQNTPWCSRWLGISPIIPPPSTMRWIAAFAEGAFTGFAARRGAGSNAARRRGSALYCSFTSS